MKRSNIFSRAWEKQRPAKPGPLFWRAEEDRPLSLSDPMRGETASSQRALVLAFAALAVAGGAFLATAMLVHHVPDLMTRAEATTPSAATTVAAGPATPPSSAPIAPIVAPAKPQPAVATPLQPEPVKVTTIKVPAKRKAPPPAEPTPPSSARIAEALPGSAELRWGPVAGNIQPSQTAESTATAYASDATPEVTGGIDALKREVIDVVAPAAKPVMVASADEEILDNGRQARVRTAVNMRARPEDGSTVVSVIPGNATVSVTPGCRYWCKVSFRGRSGYIYKGFLR